MEMPISVQEKRQIISSGTFLRSFCPHCSDYLIENDELHLRIKEANGDVGDLFLSPYLNVFLHKTTIRIPNSSIAKDIMCPRCGRSLILKERTCGECGSPVIKLVVEAVSRKIDFYICSRKGCTWHGINVDDMDDIMLDDSVEW